MSLWPHQEKCLESVFENFDNGVEKLLCVLATGTGKTRIASQVPKRFPTKQNFFIVHTDELAQQAQLSMRLENPDLAVGIEMGQLYAPESCDIIVASPQTLGRDGSTRLERFDPERMGSIQIDEAHHSVAEGYGRILSYFGVGGLGDRTGKLVVGYTATPNRGDGIGLARVFDKIAFTYSMLDAMRDGWLVPLRGFRVRTGTSLDGVSTVAGDFKQNELEKAVNTHQRNGLIVEEWLKYGEGRKTIGFCVDIQHSKDLAEEFRAAGVDAVAVWGTDPDRASKLAWHKAGEITVVLNANVLTEGYDDPTVQCVLLAAPTKSALRYIQRVGRGTRLSDGKADCIVLDFTDQTAKHSLATLPSIFGLPKNLNLKGMSITEAMGIVENARRRNPDTNLDGVEDLDNLHTYVQQVNLMDVKYAPEVEENSQYQWHKNSEGEYVLLLPAHEQVRISENLLGHYTITGKVNGNEFTDEEKTIEAAFGRADDMLRYLGRNLMKFVRREAQGFGKEPITPRQSMAVAYAFRRAGLQVPNTNGWTKHQASSVLRKLEVV